MCMLSSVAIILMFLLSQKYNLLWIIQKYTIIFEINEVFYDFLVFFWWTLNLLWVDVAWKSSDKKHITCDGYSVLYEHAGKMRYNMTLYNIYDSRGPCDVLALKWKMIECFYIYWWKWNIKRSNRNVRTSKSYNISSAVLRCSQELCWWNFRQILIKTGISL